MKILYEDHDILVVWKEAGLAVQSRKPLEKDLESLLLTHLTQKTEGEGSPGNQIDLPGSKPGKRIDKTTGKPMTQMEKAAGKQGNQLGLTGRKPGVQAEKTTGKPDLHIINRLDQPVEGFVLFALNKKAAANLTRQLTEGKIEKTYRAEVTGPIPKGEDTLVDYLVKDARTNTSRVADPKTHGAKRSVLSYRKVSENELEIHLMTGRHHQIRVQLANAGMPILGDRKYGTPNPAYRGRLMLTASGLAFAHPQTGKRMEFSDDRIPKSE